VHTRAVGLVPWIELEPTDHPLAVDQRTGITWERIREIAELACDSGSREMRNVETGYVSKEYLDDDGKEGTKD
jgi:hypothetical protein